MKLKSSLINRILPKRIWQQIFLILALAIIIPLIILGLLLIHTSQKAIKTTVFRDHKQVAMRTTGEVKEHIEGAQQVLFLTASILGNLHADTWRQETAIVELSLRNPAFQRISSVNTQGMEIATSELGTKLQNRSKEEAFLRASSGRAFISEVKISENRIPFLTLAEPIKQFGKVTGVLIAELNVRSIWTIVDGITFGELGKAYLIDQKGRIIAHPDKKLVLQNAQIPYANILQDILVGQAGNTEELDEKGDQLLISYAPIAKLDWGLIITQPESEAYAFSKTMKFQSWIIIILGIVTVVVLSLILTRYSSQPINDIIASTHRLAQGDFSGRFRIKQRNEIGKLLFSFNRMTAQLQKARDMERLSIIGKASTAVAHDLKNSLLLIETFVSLLPERYEDKKFIKEFSDTIPKELESWNTSLKNMMAFSKELEYEVEEVNVNDIISEIELLMRLKAKQSCVQFDLVQEETLPNITGNKEQLKRVLLNFLTNALDATPVEGVITMVTKIVQDDERKHLKFIEIEISNTGPTIPEEDLGQIFEPFFSKKPGGLGLGLSICKEVIGAHHGAVEVLNNANGVSFFIKFPARKSVKRPALASKSQS